MDSSSIPSTVELKHCRTSEWICALQTQQPSCSFLDSIKTTSTSLPKQGHFFQNNPSPVTDLTFHFSHQNLDGTPRRRLSLDTSETVSDASTATPDKIPISFSSPASDKNAQVFSQCSVSESSGPFPNSGLPLEKEPTTFVESCPRKKSVLFDIGGSELRYSGCTTSSGLEWEELQSPISTVSPAPSSVFYVDENTSDSGFGDSNQCKVSRSETEFAAPHFLPKARQHKLSSGDFSSGFGRKFSDDDGFCEELMEEVEAENVLPLGDIIEDGGDANGGIEKENLKQLVTGPLLNSITSKRRTQKKKASLTDTPVRLSRAPLRDINGERPKIAAVRKSGLTMVKSACGFQPCTGTKRPCQSSTPLQQTTLCSAWKRRKSVILDSSPFNFNQQNSKAAAFQRCHSETEILCPLGAAQSGYDNSDLVGDYSRSHSLPLIERPKISDLKCISSETMAALVRNEYSSLISSYQIVDCRYPYEYEGGHIIGAVNIYREDDVAEKFFNCLVLNETDTSVGRRVLIFYCEFSQQRGPTMSRLLRQRDRSLNEYPFLHYPEIYLLEGGYKQFYQKFKDLCEPPLYVRMLDQKEEITKFRKKSKSWNGGNGLETVRRPGLQRGLFV